MQADQIHYKTRQFLARHRRTHHKQAIAALRARIYTILY